MPFSLDQVDYTLCAQFDFDSGFFLRTVAIECCYQNVGIATSLALTMFKGADLNDAMGVPFLYGLCEAFFVGSFCILCWKAGWSKAPADASIWTVISTTYEVLEAEMQEICEIEVSVSSSSSDGSPEKPSEKEDGNVLTTYWVMNEIVSSHPKGPSGELIRPDTPGSPLSSSTKTTKSSKFIDENDPGLFHAEC